MAASGGEAEDNLIGRDQFARPVAPHGEERDERRCLDVGASRGKTASCELSQVSLRAAIIIDRAEQLGEPEPKGRAVVDWRIVVR